jgi:hypothetical protein
VSDLFSIADAEGVDIDTGQARRRLAQTTTQLTRSVGQSVTRIAFR